MPNAQRRPNPPPLQKPDLVETFDCEQGSDKWFALRKGLATASGFASIMSTGEEAKMRATLMNRLAAERIFDRPMETFTNAAMERGKVMEADALNHYAFTRDAELSRVGFVRRTIYKEFGDPLVVGASPDSLVGDDGLLQVKTMQPDLIVKLIDSGRVPIEHKWQCLGEMWVTGRRWCDLMIYYKDFPISPVFQFEWTADIDALAKAVEVFDYDLRQLVTRVKTKGRVR